AHRLVLHRPPRAGDSLRTGARVLEVAPRRAGTLVVSRFETVDAGGKPVSTTDYASVYRGVALAVAEERPAGRDAGGAREDGRVRWQEAVEVGATAGHIYTECARIWNPIHTDVALARAAGLPGPILHGTATLALAVSRVVRRDLPAVDRSPAGLAQATLRFHDHYGSDFLKITPHGGYAVEAWGCVEAEEVLPDGHRACASCAVKRAEDWKRIRPLDPMSAE